MYRFKTKKARCKQCGSTIVEQFEIVIPEVNYLLYQLFLSRKSCKNLSSANWQVRSRGFTCSRKGCTYTVTHNPQRGYTVKDVRKRLEYITYHVNNIRLFQYQDNFFTQQEASPQYVEHYSGNMYLDSPKLYTGPAPEFRNITSRIVESSSFVRVAKSAEDLYKDFNHWYLVRRKDLAKLKRKEVTSIITL